MSLTSDYKIKKRFLRYLDKDVNPSLIIDQDGRILFFNEAAKKGPNSLIREQFSGGKISQYVKLSKQSRDTQVITAADHADLSYHISPLTAFQNGGKHLVEML